MRRVFQPLYLYIGCIVGFWKEFAQSNPITQGTSDLYMLVLGRWPVKLAGLCGPCPHPLTRDLHHCLGRTAVSSAEGRLLPYYSVFHKGET